MARRVSWTVLTVLLGLLVLGCLTFDRSPWLALMGDEATYLMQAESLAWDGDLLYSRQDFQRFSEHWRHPPQGLILQSGDSGARMIFGKPFFYALYLVPFVRLAPTRGPFVANALLLALTSLWVARVLGRRLGELAPLWVAVFVFASVTFAHVFWAHPDLFLMCLTALALALAVDRADGSGGGTSARGAAGPWPALRWLAAGALLAIVGYSRPPYLPLFLPALVAIPRDRRRLAIPALVAGGLIVFVAAVAVYLTLAGSWTSYGAERLGFYAHTGFPEVDFPASEWRQKIREWGNAAASPPGSVPWGERIVPSLWLWNGIYFFLGRHVGLLPYFLPFLLGLAARPRDATVRIRWSLVLAVALACGALLLLRPFNFYGGGGTLANRYFLPLYPALWLVAARPLRLRWLVLVAALSGPFLADVWLHSRDFPLTPERTYRYVSPVAERWLPFETTQSHLKLAGREDLYLDGLYVRLLSHEVRPDPDGSLHLRGGSTGKLLVGSPGSLAAVDLELAAPAPATVAAAGGTVRPLGASAAGQRFRILLPRPRARHPMWWTWQPVDLRVLTLRIDGAGDEPVAFRLSAPADGG